MVSALSRRILPMLNAASLAFSLLRSAALRAASDALSLKLFISSLTLLLLVPLAGACIANFAVGFFAFAAGAAFAVTGLALVAAGFALAAGFAAGFFEGDTAIREAPVQLHDPECWYCR
jgi:hypothetical protein